MDLLIDIGNSRIKWALRSAGSLHDAGSTEHCGGNAAVNVMLDAITTAPTGVIATNVAGDQFGALLAGMVKERWGLPVQFAVTQLQAGPVRNGYDDFQQLGIDRWLAIIAAVDRFAGSICIVDAGTAITIDAVATNGAHLGGYIIPGLALMHQSLGAETGDLYRLVGNKQQISATASEHAVLGRSTVAAIAGGTVTAVCCLIEQCVETLRAGGNDPIIVVTGGDARRLMDCLDAGMQHRPQLVLEGLALYEFDTSSGRRVEG
jgi:type III pantothenate kinase